jgi:hypothetical protein
MRHCRFASEITPGANSSAAAALALAGGGALRSIRAAAGRAGAARREHADAGQHDHPPPPRACGGAERFEHRRVSTGAGEGSRSAGRDPPGVARGGTGVEAAATTRRARGARHRQESRNACAGSIAAVGGAHVRVVLEQLAGGDHPVELGLVDEGSTRRPRARPGRGARVVTLTTARRRVALRRTFTTLPLPTPDGPDRTVSR